MLTNDISFENFRGNYKNSNGLNDFFTIFKKNKIFLLRRTIFGNEQQVGQIIWEEKSIPNRVSFKIKDIEGELVPTYNITWSSDYYQINTNQYNAIKDKYENLVFNKINFNTFSKAKEIVKKFVAETLYNKSIDQLSTEESKIGYAALDLNGDQKLEYIIGIFNMDYCGSGGCTFWVLDKNHKMISKTSVANMPLTISKNKSNGWYDIISFSSKSYRKIVFDGKSYTSNASIGKEISEKEKDALTLATVLFNN